MQNKKNSFQVGVIEHNQKKVGWRCTQKPKTIFHQYQWLPRYVGSNSSTFCPFSVCKILVTCPGSPKLSLTKALISTPIVSKSQLYPSSCFGIISELINFQSKLCNIFYAFLCLNSRSSNLGSPKLLPLMTLSLILMLNPNFNFLYVLPFAGYLANQSSYAKTRKQKQWYYGLSQSLNYGEVLLNFALVIRSGYWMIVDNWQFTDAALSCFTDQIIKVTSFAFCPSLFCLSWKVKTSLSFA